MVAPGKSSKDGEVEADDSVGLEGGVAGAEPPLLLGLDVAPEATSGLSTSSRESA